MRSIGLITLFAAVTMLYAACGRFSGGGVEETPLSFTMQRYADSSGSCDDGSWCVRVGLSWPKYLGEGALEDSLRRFTDAFILNRHFEHGSVARPSELFTVLQKMHAETQRAFDDYALPWELQRELYVTWVTAEIVTLEGREYSFTGGAHPNARTLLQSFASGDGHRLTIDDMLLPDGRHELLRRAEKEFRHVRGLPAAESLDEAGFWFPDGMFQLPQQYALDEEGLRLYYNSYEVAPYSMGPTECVVPWSALSGLIHETYRPLAN